MAADLLKGTTLARLVLVSLQSTAQLLTNNGRRLAGRKNLIFEDFRLAKVKVQAG